MSNLTELVNHIKRSGGVARTNRFRVNISLPSSVVDKLASENVGTPDRTVSIMCQSVTNIGTNINFQDVNTLQTSSRKMPYNRHGGSDLELVFLCSEGLIEQTIFELWSKSIVANNYMTEFFDDYVSDITVEHLDVAGNVSKTVTYIECYPQVVGVISEDKTVNDTLLTLSVTFSATKKKPHTEDMASRSNGRLGTIKFGTKAKALVKKPPIVLLTAPPGYLLTSPHTSDIIKSVERIKQEVTQSSMNVQMSNFLFRNLLVSIGQMEGIPTIYQEGITSYINEVIQSLNK